MLQPTDEQAYARDLFLTGDSLAIEAGAGTVTHVPIPGFAGYTVTDSGEVWTWLRSNGRRPRVLMPAPYRRLSPGRAGSNGYEQVWLYKDGLRHGRFVHLLVLEVFVGPRPSDQQARHLNGNERDNRRTNLSWGTPVENMADRDFHGSTARGERVGTAVLTAEIVRSIRSAVANGESRRSLERRLPVSRRQIGRIVAGTSWSHVQ